MINELLIFSHSDEKYERDEIEIHNRIIISKMFTKSCTNFNANNIGKQLRTAMYLACFKHSPIALPPIPSPEMITDKKELRILKNII